MEQKTSEARKDRPEYDDEYRKLRNEIEAYRRRNGVSHAEIARNLSVSSATWTQWRAEKYTGNVGHINALVKSFLELQAKRAKSPVEPEFVMTSAARLVLDTVNYAAVNRKMVVIVGRAGTGKTKALDYYMEEHHHTVMMTINPTISVHTMMVGLAKLLGVSTKGNSYYILQKVLFKLKQSPRLLIIDEAQLLSYRSFELLRAIHDEASVGVVLSGALSLLDKLTGRTSRTGDDYDQLYSRVRVKRELRDLTAEDVRLIVGQRIPDISDELVQYLLERSGGNARMLTNITMLALQWAKGESPTEQEIDRAARYLLAA